MELEGHTDSVTGAALCGSGGMLVSASLDATARVWDLHTSKCLFVLTGHSGGVTAVAIDAKGRYCLTASADTTTRYVLPSVHTTAVVPLCQQPQLNSTLPAQS